MPLYEYACTECGHRFEILQSMGSPSLGVSCPKCEGTKVAKQLSTFASAIAGAATSSPLPCGAPNASACGSGGFS